MFNYNRNHGRYMALKRYHLLCSFTLQWEFVSLSDRYCLVLKVMVASNRLMDLWLIGGVLAVTRIRPRGSFSRQVERSVRRPLSRTRLGLTALSVFYYYQLLQVMFTHMLCMQANFHEWDAATPGIRALVQPLSTDKCWCST